MNCFKPVSVLARIGKFRRASAKRMLFPPVALAALALSADVGIAADSESFPAPVAVKMSSGNRNRALGQFIAALLEKDSARRAEMLLEVIAADPENAEIPLAYFSRAAIGSKKAACWAGKLNPLWKQRPGDFHFAFYGALLNLAARNSPEEVEKRLETFFARKPECRSGETPDRYALLLKFYLGSALRTGNCRHADRVFRKLLDQLPPDYQFAARVAALEFYDTAALRADVAGNEKEAGRFDEFYDRLLAAAGKEALSSPVAQGRLIDSLLRRRQLEDALDFAATAVEKRETLSSLRLLELVAARIGDLKTFNAARKKILELDPRAVRNNPQLRFTALLNAGEFDSAAREISRFPAAARRDARIQLLTEKKDFRALRDMLLKESKPNVGTGLQLLIVAEKLRDHEAFAAARRLLSAPAANNPRIANALGYVGAVLNTDLEQGSRYLKFALGKEPENSAFLDSLAWIRFKQGRLAEAQELIRRALRFADPSVGVAVLLEHAGDIAAARGEDPQAFYRKAWKYAPDDPEIDAAALKKKIIFKK